MADSPPPLKCVIHDQNLRLVAQTFVFSTKNSAVITLRKLDIAVKPLSNVRTLKFQSTKYETLET